MKKKKTISDVNKPKDPFPSCRRPRERLLAKIAEIRRRIPDIQPSGEEKDEHGRNLFFYTEAQKVFSRYIEVLKDLNMLVRPYAAPGMMPQLAVSGRLVCVAMCFEIIDCDTGESLIGPGVGAGINYDWAANTAQTRALKQFFLTSFGATWKDDELVAKEEADKMLQRASDPQHINETLAEMKSFFEQSLNQKDERKENEQANRDKPGDSRKGTRAHTGKAKG